MKLIKYFPLYIKMASRNIQAKMEYRTDFIISSIGMLFFNGIGLASIWILFQSIPILKGWTYPELVFLYSFSMLAVLPAQIFFDNFWSLRRYIQDGSFIKHYFRPINMMFNFVSELIDVKGFAQGVMAIGLLIWSSIELNVPWNLPFALFFIALLFTSSLVMTSMLIASSSTCFWIVNSFSIMMLAYRFRDFSKYPLTIFNDFFKVAFTFIIPIGYISFYPSEFLIHPDTSTYLVYLSPVVGIILFMGAYFVWKKGVRAWSGTGT